MCSSQYNICHEFNVIILQFLAILWNLSQTEREGTECTFDEKFFRDLDLASLRPFYHSRLHSPRNRLLQQ